MNSREQLILDHMPQVRLLATRQHRLCPPSVELDDLMSVATVGLLQAVEKFRPERGFKLKTLAEHRIRGAMWTIFARLILCRGRSAHLPGGAKK